KEILCMARQRHRVGTAVRTNGNACSTGTSDIDPIIAGTQHLHQSQPRRPGIGLIRQEAHKSHKVLRLLHSGSDVLGTGVRWQNMQCKSRWLHRLRLGQQVRWQLTPLGKDNCFLRHDSLHSLPTCAPLLMVVDEPRSITTVRPFESLTALRRIEGKTHRPEEDGGATSAKSATGLRTDQP